MADYDSFKVLLYELRIFDGIICENEFRKV